jgi:predicted Zn-dependent protease
MTRAIAFGLLAALALAPGSAPAAPNAVEKSPVLDAMEAELQRAMQKLRLKRYEAPYFIAYAVRDSDSREVTGRFGALVSSGRGRNRTAYVEVRVGDYQLDNTTSDRDHAFDPDSVDSWEPPTEAPLDNPEALRATLWLLTDTKYKRALAAYAKKRGRRATTLVEDESLPSFSREPATAHVDPPRPLAFDEEALAARARRLSQIFREDPLLLDGMVKISADRARRHFASSEGTRVVTERAIYAMHIEATTRAPDGMLLVHEKDFYGGRVEELPSEEEATRQVRRLLDELKALRAAPVIDPYTGPALLMEEAAGVFFHETVGHRLEGERQNDEKEGRTFKGQVGKRVLPPFLSIIDDPTTAQAATAAGAQALNGSYAFDDEGVAARAVTLVEGGVLRDYIKSRTPIPGSLRSNGHGRAEGSADPMGRMGNLFVRSTKRVPVAELKKMLLEEVRRQNKPFGLIIRDITGGSTNTTNYGYQAFKGQPRLVYRVDAKSGEETLVRGVEMVGTPLATVSKIVATSDTVGVFNGYCGAESGFVPVSTVAPAMLMTEIELQRTQKAAERPPILPPPWPAPTSPTASR